MREHTRFKVQIISTVVNVICFDPLAQCNLNVLLVGTINPLTPVRQTDEVSNNSEPSALSAAPSVLLAHTYIYFTYQR